MSEQSNRSSYICLGWSNKRALAIMTHLRPIYAESVGDDKMTIARIISILCISFLLSGQGSEEVELEDAFDRDILVITASEHACYVFDIYLAMTPAQKSRGLMYHTARHIVHPRRRFDCQYRGQYRTVVIDLDQCCRVAELRPGTQRWCCRAPGDRYRKPRALPFNCGARRQLTRTGN